MSIDSRKIEPVIATEITTSEAQGILDVQYPVETSIRVIRVEPEFSRSLDIKLNEDDGKSFLQARHWPIGLQNVLLSSIAKFPYRIFLIDDSGSMLTSDGHKAVGSGIQTRMVTCTRWAEIVDSMSFHAQLCHTFGCPGEFRLLNRADGTFLIGQGENSEIEYKRFLEALEEPPGGKTPLCTQVDTVVKIVNGLTRTLAKKKQRVCIIIATDGEATDGDLVDHMRPLQNLPVWVVVRLCTDDNAIVEYWNNIDSQLELEMDVLDDLKGEALEVHSFNPWLTYALPIQRLREFGASVKEMDLIDESLLTVEQMMFVVSMLLFDENEVPHAVLEWKSFASAVKARLERDFVWDPITRTPKPWIDLKLLEKTYLNSSDDPQSSVCLIS